MKANELRIGNWFIDYDAEPETTIYWQVESIDKASNNPNQKHLGVRFRNRSCWAATDIIDPIPLNEEWLIKFGASCDRVSGESVYYLTIVDSQFCFVFTDGEYSLVDSNSKILISFGSEYYVHQLQNLYFFLTGQELEIKPLSNER